MRSGLSWPPQLGFLLLLLAAFSPLCSPFGLRKPQRHEEKDVLQHWLFKRVPQAPVQCKDDLFVYMQPKYKGLHNQVNVFIMGLQVADMYNATLVLPDWHSHYEAFIDGQAERAPVCTSGSPDDLAHTQPPKCTLVLEFNQIFNEEHFYRHMRPYHCIIKSSVARQKGIIPSMSHMKDWLASVHWDVSIRNLMNSAVLYNATAAAEAAAQLTGFVAARQMPVFYVKTRVGPGTGTVQAAQYLQYMQLRLRAAAFTEPALLVRQYSDKVLDGLLKAGPEFNSVHFRVEKDMQDWLVRTGKPFMNSSSVVLWLSHQEVINKELPLFVAIDNIQDATDVKALFKAAGFHKVLTKLDFAPELAEITSHREFRAEVERAVLEKAKVFVGNHHSSLSFYIYEKRRAMGLLSLDYHELNPNVDTFKLVSKHNARTLNLQPLNICIWALVDLQPFQASIYFVLALEQAMERMGHQVTLVQDTAPKHMATVTDADLHLVAQSQLTQPLLTKLMPTAGHAAVLFLVDELFGDMRKDSAMFQAMHSYQTAVSTVFKDEHLLKEALALGHQPKSPVAVGHAANPQYFYPPIAKLPLSSRRKINIVASVCHDQFLQSYEIIQYLGVNLNMRKYGIQLVYIKVDVPATQNVVILPALEQQELGTLLRSADIFLLAAVKECYASDALLTALACGLPVLAPNLGSYPQTIGQGGLLYNGVRDIIWQLEQVVSTHAELVKGISVPHIDEVAVRLLQASGRF